MGTNGNEHRRYFHQDVGYNTTEIFTIENIRKGWIVITLRGVRRLTHEKGLPPGQQKLARVQTRSIYLINITEN
jgi:hypothetical protein